MVVNDQRYPVSGQSMAVQSGYDVNESLVYTPIMTSNPLEFDKLGYKCRFASDNTVAFIVITMYNEGPEELTTTLRGVCENVKAFVDREDDKQFWKRIAVCIVSDGRGNASQETLDWATERGLFSQDDVDRQLNKDADVGVHLFESTIMWTEETEATSKYPPIQIMMALKERNGGKIDSHYWFFSAFAAQIKPEYCFLLDVGTRPMPKALYFLWETMSRNTQIGGCCGEISTMSKFSCNLILSGQTFEYKVSNYLDKATESVCGYISVLPGAFSAYRFAALTGSPLQKYFHHIATPMDKLTPFEANQYLAEDRILCFEILAKAGCDYTLHYDRRAVAKTDAPTELVDLIKQRRRWLNGSLLATFYTVINTGRFLKNTSHTPKRKFVITMQFLYYIFQLLMTWFIVANVYLTFSFSLIVILGRDHVLFAILRYIFIGLVITQFVLGLGNRPGSVKMMYMGCAVLWSFIFLLTTALSIYTLAIARINPYLLIVVFILSIGSIFVAAIFHREIVVVSSNAAQYFLVAPVFLVMFPVYSICNLHDISWGTKGISDAAEIKRDDRADKNADVDERVRAKLRRIAKMKAAEKVLRVAQQERFGRFRTYVLLLWIFSQGLYVSLVLSYEIAAANTEAVAKYFLQIMFIVVATTNSIRFCGSAIYLALHNITKKKKVPAYPAIQNKQ